MATILMVEDDALNREMLVRRLLLAKHTVITAENGIEAVECAYYEQPDLILMDLCLPILSGIDATLQIWANPHTSHIPIITLTAYAMSFVRRSPPLLATTNW